MRNNAGAGWGGASVGAEDTTTTTTTTTCANTLSNAHCQMYNRYGKYIIYIYIILYIIQCTPTGSV